MQVEEYIREDSSNPFRLWFEKLNAPAAAEVATALLRLEAGNVSSLKWIGGGLGECRIDWGPGYRVYLARENDALLILFGGGTKKRQQGDIDRARILLAEYRARKGGKR